MGFWDEIAIDKVNESNKYIDNIEMGLELLTRLLSANTEITETEKKMQQLDKLIEYDYMELIKQDDLANEAEMYVQIIKARNIIEEMIKFPFLTNKNIVAIGGGFSAGKSRLINSLLGEDILPTDTRPTTSIPSYIARGKHTNIYAFNIFDNKTKIDKEAVKAISHMFANRYNLSFTQILKNIVLQSDKMVFSNIAFLDTPGYTKSDFYTKQDNTDENVARVHLKEADYLIWIVDIEKGTIPSQDLDFIKSLDFNKPIFFVFNKADKKEPSEIENIINTAEENIRKVGIEIAGITAYSSLDNREYVRNSLIPFLIELDKSKKEINVCKEFSKVFDVYLDHLATSIKDEKIKLEIFNKIALFSNLKKEKKNITHLISKSQKKIKTQKILSKKFAKLSEFFDIVVKEIINELENDKLSEEQKNIIDNNREKLVEEIINRIEKNKARFEEQCVNMSAKFDIEDIKTEDFREEIEIKKIEDQVNICKWYNPFTWNKTKTIIREVPEVKKVPYLYIRKSNLEEKIDIFISDIYNCLINISDDICKIDIDLNSIIDNEYKELIDSDYMQRDLTELFEEIRQAITYHVNSIYYDGKEEKKELLNMIESEIIAEDSFDLLDKVIEEKIKHISNNALEVLENGINELDKDIYSLIRR